MGPFSTPVRQAVRSAEHEARLRAAHRIGLEHLLLGLVSVPDRQVAGWLHTDLPSARVGLDRLDLAALASVGVLPAQPVGRPVPTRGRVSMTTAARNAVIAALMQAKATRERAITTQRLFAAVLSAPGPNTARDLVRELGQDPEELLRRLDQAA